MRSLEAVSATLPLRHKDPRTQSSPDHVTEESKGAKSLGQEKTRAQGLGPKEPDVETQGCNDPQTQRLGPKGLRARPGPKNPEAQGHKDPRIPKTKDPRRPKAWDARAQGPKPAWAARQT